MPAVAAAASLSTSIICCLKTYLPFHLVCGQPFTSGIAQTSMHSCALSSGPDLTERLQTLEQSILCVLMWQDAIAAREKVDDELRLSQVQGTALRVSLLACSQ